MAVVVGEMTVEPAAAPEPAAPPMTEPAAADELTPALRVRIEQMLCTRAERHERLRAD